MKKQFDADINWITYENGGRRWIPREGTRYCPLIRLDEDGSFVEWSIDFICPDFTEDNRISFVFLVDGAPEHLVNVGSQYGIYEGNRKVAEISIVESLED